MSTNVLGLRGRLLSLFADRHCRPGSFPKGMPCVSWHGTESQPIFRSICGPIFRPASSRQHRTEAAGWAHSKARAPYLICQCPPFPASALDTRNSKGALPSLLCSDPRHPLHSSLSHAQASCRQRDNPSYTAEFPWETSPLEGFTHLQQYASPFLVSGKKKKNRRVTFKSNVLCMTVTFSHTQWLLLSLYLAMARIPVSPYCPGVSQRSEFLLIMLS